MVVMFLMIVVVMLENSHAADKSSADGVDIEEKTCLVEEGRRTPAASPRRSSSTR